MRFRLTIRGENLELRGRMDADSSLRLNEFATDMTPFGTVIASIADDDYDPFAITEPGYPPTAEGSRQVITGMMEDTDAAGFIDRLVQMHLMQAQVIRGERYLRERAEAELRDRELHHFEVEQENERLKADHTDSEKSLIDVVNAQADVIEQIKAIRSNFPEKCEVHDQDDITCGWKSMIAGIDKALESQP